MTSELKCPFCGRKLGRKNINDRMCSNEKCVSWKGNFYGSEDLWQELIRTRKELDVAKYAIKNIKNDMKKVKDGDDIWEIQKNLHDYCETTIKKITALTKGNSNDR